MSLSDKITDVCDESWNPKVIDNDGYCDTNYIHVNDIKAAVKELKERKCFCGYEKPDTYHGKRKCSLCKNIKEIFGGELSNG